MLAQKVSWRKDIFVTCAKKTNLGTPKWLCTKHFFSFLHRSQKICFHYQTFCAGTKYSEVYPNFVLEFFDILKENKKCLYNGCISTYDPKHCVLFSPYLILFCKVPKCNEWKLFSTRTIISNTMNTISIHGNYFQL